MKKIYTLLLALAAGSALSISAQQLPNAGFENSWSNCTPWTSKNNTKTQGTTPSPWIVSNTVGTGTLGKTTVAYQATGYNSNTAVELKAGSYSGKNIPGYMSLGTAWSTASGLTGGNADGGTFGGYAFTYRPDAVSFYYKRTGSSVSSENATVIIYSWKGTWTQANVPGNIVAMGSTTTVNMTDRERNILGMSTSQGGTVSKTSDAELIAHTTKYISGAQENWTNLEIPIDYITSSTPAKINVIFAGGEYFESAPKTNGNSFIIDDVKLVYYSRLASLSVNGASVNGFDSKTYSYTIDSEMPTSATAFTFTTLGNSGSASASVSLDTENAVATITVTNSNAGGTDYDGASSHTYTLQFNKASEDGGESGSEENTYGGDVYAGTVTIFAVEAGLGDEDVVRSGNVHIIADENDATKCTLALPDFALDDTPEGYIGDIVVPGINITSTGDGKHYSGSINPLNLTMAGMDIVAKVTVDGDIDNSDAATFNISVIWLMDPEGDPEGEYSGFPINVQFNGQKEESGSEEEEEIDYCQPTGVAGRYNSENQTTYDGRNVTNIVVSDGTSSVTIEGSSSSTTRAIVYDRTTSIMNTEAGKTISMDVTGEGSWMNTFVYVDFNKDGFNMSDQVYENYTLKNQISQGNDVTTSFTFPVPGTATPGNYRARYILDWQNTDPCKYGQAKTYSSNNDNGEVVIDFIISIKGTSGIGDIEIDNSNAPVEYYNINGIRVNAENLTPGLYIRRQGTDVKKVLVK